MGNLCLGPATSDSARNEQTTHDDFPLVLSGPSKEGDQQQTVIVKSDDVSQGAVEQPQTGTVASKEDDPQQAVVFTSSGTSIPAARTRRLSQGKGDDLKTVEDLVAKPYPSRPKSCPLSQHAWDSIEELFHMMDADGSNGVTREEAVSFFKGVFRTVSADAMFQEVDKDHSEVITGDEFVDFWCNVKRSGYEEEDILSEVAALKEGNSWVDWNDGVAPPVTEGKKRKSQVSFPPRPFFCRVSKVTWSKCEELFRKMDVSATGAISYEDSLQFFSSSGSFGAVSAKGMFNEVDVENHGSISTIKFMDFWRQVRASGYSDKDICVELDNILEGGAWVDWKDGRTT